MLSLLVPPDCGACGDFRPFEEPGVALPELCADCSARLRDEVSGAEGHLDPVEIGSRAAPLRVWSCGAFEGLLRDLIRSLKYNGQRGLVRPVGQLLADRAATITGPPCELVVPVAIHWRRFAGRGFNQAWLLGERVGHRLGCPQLPALVRRAAVRPQVGLAELERRDNVAQAFSVRGKHSSKVRGRNLLVVDDVCTTGATLRACAAVLREAGAASVRALVLARTTRSGDSGLITCL